MNDYVHANKFVWCRYFFGYFLSGLNLINIEINNYTGYLTNIIMQIKIVKDVES